MEFKDSSDDATERLCDSTIDLMKSLEIMLMEVKSQRQPEAPCQCNRGQRRGKEQQDRQATVCSNASNLAASHSRVITAPDEIPLRLRLESWICDDGVLMVKPSVHRECSPDACQQLLLTAANNNTAASAARPAALQPAATSDTMEDDGGAAGDFDECVDTEDRELHQSPQQQQKQQRVRRQHQPASHKTSAAARKRQQQPQPQPQPQPSQQQPPVHRRERHQQQQQQHQVKQRHGPAPAAAAAAQPATIGTRSRREATRGETLSLLRDLHRLLSAKMQPSATPE